MAPLSKEIRPVSSCTPQHIGPAIPEVRADYSLLLILGSQIVGRSTTEREEGREGERVREGGRGGGLKEGG